MDGDEYSEQLIAISELVADGDLRRLDEALESLMWALCRRPEEWSVIPGTKALRVAKTRRYGWPGGTIPRLRLYFSIPNHYQVDLRWIEVDPEEDL